MISRWVRRILKIGPGYNPGFWNPTRVIRDSRSPGFQCWCDTYARLFAYAVQAKGIPSRVIWLSGHVVPEVFFQNRWIMIDPTFDYYVYKDGRVLSVTEIIEMYKNGEDVSKHVRFITGVKGDDGTFDDVVDKYVKNVYTNGYTLILNGEKTVAGNRTVLSFLLSHFDKLYAVFTGKNYTAMQKIESEQQKLGTWSLPLRYILVLNSVLIVAAIIRLVRGKKSQPKRYDM
jgi:hypothetical protein